MAQNWEDCEVFEIDAEEPSAGTMVAFPNGNRPTISRPYSEAVNILQQAGWNRIQEGYTEADSRVMHLRRRSQPGRMVDDALDKLRDI